MSDELNGAVVAPESGFFHRIVDIAAGEGVTGARVRNVKSDEASDVPAGGIFMAIGHTPNTSVFADQLEMDLFRSDGFSERDLSKSLDSGAKRSRERPFFKLRYNLPEEKRAEIRERVGELLPISTAEGVFDGDGLALHVFGEDRKSVV